MCTCVGGFSIRLGAFSCIEVQNKWAQWFSRPHYHSNKSKTGKNRKSLTFRDPRERTLRGLLDGKFAIAYMWFYEILGQLRRSNLVYLMHRLEALEATPVAAARWTWATRAAAWELCAAPRWASSCRVGCCCRSLRRVHIRLLLRLDDVLLVADPLVAKPVTNLGSAAAIWIYCIKNDYTYFTCDTVMPHFLANSSLTSSDG